MEVKFSPKSKETIRDLGSPERTQICYWKLRGAGKMEVRKEQTGTEPQLLGRLRVHSETPTPLKSG